MGRNDYTGLLYSQPSLIEGFARVLDVGGTFDEYNYCPTEDEADHLALASDWYAVGSDLYHTISCYAVRSDQYRAIARFVASAIARDTASLSR